MSKILTMFSGGDFISAAELGEKKATMTINNVKSMKFDDDDGKNKTRPVVSFKETPRGWVLCKTNALALAAMFGEETETWTGKRVTIHSEVVQVGPEKKPGLRVSGSPDIDKPIKFSVKLPKRKAFIITLVPTGKTVQTPVMETPATLSENTQETVSA